MTVRPMSRATSTVRSVLPSSTRMTSSTQPGGMSASVEARVRSAL